MDRMLELIEGLKLTIPDQSYIDLMNALRDVHFARADVARIGELLISPMETGGGVTVTGNDRSIDIYDDMSVDINHNETTLSLNSTYAICYVSDHQRDLYVCSEDREISWQGHEMRFDEAWKLVNYKRSDRIEYVVEYPDGYTKVVGTFCGMKGSEWFLKTGTPTEVTLYPSGYVASRRWFVADELVGEEQYKDGAERVSLDKILNLKEGTIQQWSGYVTAGGIGIKPYLSALLTNYVDAERN